MSVRPTSSGQVPRPGIERAGSSEPGNTARRPETGPAPVSPQGRRDEVEISSQARELQQSGAASGPSGEIAPAALRQVLDRISQGHYDRPEVQDQVVRALSKDL